MSEKSVPIGSPKDMQDVIFKAKSGHVYAGYYSARQKIFIIGWTGAIGESQEDVEQWYDLTYALECCENNPLYN
jgi:hypothetical protein